MLTLTNIAFILLAIITIVPAILVVTLKNVFHSALFLVLSLTGVAGFFALLGADFLFAVQLLLYSGGITVLLLFVVLLSGSPKDWVIRSVNAQWMGAMLLSAVLLWLLASILHYFPEGGVLQGDMQPTTASIGLLLFRDMILPFEAISLVLLVALVGAIVFSQRETGKKGAPRV
jgi:NADH-quinone oxidoreductase subunit J